MELLKDVATFDRRACIYLFKNRINDKVYVGQTQDLRRRYMEHKKHVKGWLFKRAIEAHGFESFDLYVLETIVKIKDKMELRRLMNEREQHYLDLYQSYDTTKGYNLVRQAGSAVGYKLTDEQIAHRLTIKRPKGKDSPSWGRKSSEETKKRQAATKIGTTTFRRKVKQIDPNTGEVIKTWEALNVAAKAVGTTGGSIAAVASKRVMIKKRNGKTCQYVQHTAGGYKWEYDGELIVGFVRLSDLA